MPDFSWIKMILNDARGVSALVYSCDSGQPVLTYRRTASSGAGGVLIEGCYFDLQDKPVFRRQMTIDKQLSVRYVVNDYLRNCQHSVVLHGDIVDFESGPVKISQLTMIPMTVPYILAPQLDQLASGAELTFSVAEPELGAVVSIDVVGRVLPESLIEVSYLDPNRVPSKLIMNRESLKVMEWHGSLGPWILQAGKLQKLNGVSKFSYS